MTWNSELGDKLDCNILNFFYELSPKTQSITQKIAKNIRDAFQVHFRQIVYIPAYRICLEVVEISNSGNSENTKNKSTKILNN